MPMLNRPGGEICYEEFGQGFPTLLFAPGGLRSRLDNWHRRQTVRSARRSIGPRLWNRRRLRGMESWRFW
jgi:hypothetical protein